MEYGQKRDSGMRASARETSRRDGAVDKKNRSFLPPDPPPGQRVRIWPSGVLREIFRTRRVDG